MPVRYEVREHRKDLPDGTEAIMYLIDEFIMVGDAEIYHRNSEVGFTTRQKAEAWIAENSKPA